MDRVQMINNYVQNKEQKEIEQQTNEMIEFYKLYGEVQKLKPRMKELLRVGKACEKNQISLKSGNFNFENYEHGHFISNSWSHLLGFITNFDAHSVREGKEYCHNHSMDWKGNICGIGIIGGGCCHYNLTILIDDDDFDIKVSGDNNYVLKRFVDEFDDFENSFYEYVDRVCKGAK